MRSHRPILLAAALTLAAPAGAQQLPDKGQSEPAFRRYLAVKPGFARDVAAFEDWLARKKLADILPTWQILRTASMWDACNGPPFEVPPPKSWRQIAPTLRFVRDHVVPTLGAVEAVSVYRNPELNACAGGARRSAHRDFSALDLVPIRPWSRRAIFKILCPAHAAKGSAHAAGLGFYSFTRFHVDTRGFRRYGSAGPLANESPCALLERGQDPEAPPIPLERIPMPLPIPLAPPRL